MRCVVDGFDGVRRKGLVELGKAKVVHLVKLVEWRRRWRELIVVQVWSQFFRSLYGIEVGVRC